MYAVVSAGSRQFKVKEGETLVVDRVKGNEGDTFTFDKVLLVGGDKLVVGAPLVADALVTATIKSHTRAEKVTIFKYKRRKNYKRTRGHRQPQSVLEITKIQA